MKPDSVYFDPKAAISQQETDAIEYQEYLKKKEKEEQEYQELGKLIVKVVLYFSAPLFMMWALNYIFPALALNYLKSFILFNLIKIIK
jgi:hypothetical protein